MLYLWDSQCVFHHSVRCEAFVYHLNDLESESFAEPYILSKWDIRHLDSGKPKVGESIIAGIDKPSSEFYIRYAKRRSLAEHRAFFPIHFATCLAEDLYISKLGSFPLLISDLATILTLYESEYTLVIKPKEK